MMRIGEVRTEKRVGNQEGRCLVWRREFEALFFRIHMMEGWWGVLETSFEDLAGHGHRIGDMGTASSEDW